ncbi:Uncharacterized conserved protein, DUF885 familyt [Sphingomonas guangdongensis]|uniref:Uncharacterized conserved protein, DUF885 familyt n=1 Tax=Sphingomonas guangdongensis TaxID=1141890 RepID=A0A285R5A1_9SPHN|nr:DUF885 family protein [Sphingomonas guangdongensis]SOB87532.1 Uncharacterized conserved protein, DUF885 familyt [Sphingomonas guangdongensis]
MTPTRRDVIGSGIAGLTLATLPAPLAAQARTGRALAETLAEEYMRLAPESATSLGVDTGPRAALKRQVADPTPAGRARRIAWLQDAVRRIDALPATSVDPDSARHLSVARTAYQTALDGFAFPYGDVAIGGFRNGPYVVAQNMGRYLDTPNFLDATHSIERASDADAYLARLARWPQALDAETARLREARAQGVIAPDFSLDVTLRQLRQTRDTAPGEARVVTSLATRAAAYGGDRVEKAEALVRDQVGPALDRQIAELEAHRRLARSDAGVWKLPDGARYYAWALRAATTTTAPPAELHRTGLAQIAELQAEMEPILRSLGMTQGSVGVRMRALATDPRFAFSAGDKGRAEIIAFIQGRLDDLRPRLPRAFRTLTRGNVEVRRIAIAEEAGAPGAYGGPGSIDGKVPGRFWINLKDPAAHTRWNLPTLTYHEAIPGHVWEGEYSQRLPLLRALMDFNPYSEGWALYAEQTAGELGVYDDDPVGRLGYLNSMVFRAARLVADTGLHDQRWTRDRARQWFAEVNGDTVEGVASEIDRYCVWPGQACGYKVGHNELNRQRERAKAALGARFDVRDYNQLVVGGGSRPLSVVAADVERWIKA